ncbi:hypothetical protein HA397_30125, partial [Escherichia coli]|nr:hypothetical protein [Escherichia coli]
LREAAGIEEPRDKDEDKVVPLKPAEADTSEDDAEKEAARAARRAEREARRARRKALREEGKVARPEWASAQDGDTKIGKSS